MNISINITHKRGMTLVPTLMILTLQHCLLLEIGGTLGYLSGNDIIILDP